MIQEDELEKAEDLFEYVDDREYAKIVQKRQEEGFVLDDVGKREGGGGWEGGEEGMGEWGEEGRGNGVRREGGIG